ncbi:hypothetical protein ID866_8329 [Astraeus odoratus]|nr:hypothetical protein ID866_8329 [Astraeus odoratus]
MTENRPKKHNFLSRTRRAGESRSDRPHPPVDSMRASQTREAASVTRPSTPRFLNALTHRFHRKASRSSVGRDNINVGDESQERGHMDLPGSTADSQAHASSREEIGGATGHMVFKNQDEPHGNDESVSLVPSEMQSGEADATRSTLKGEPGSGTVQEIREDMVSKALEDAKSGIEQVQGIPGMAKRYTNVVGAANNTMQQFDTFNATYLQPLQTFNTVVKNISHVHPYAKMALGVLSWASETIIAQENRDASINALTLKICEFYKFITEDDRLTKLLSVQEALNNIAEQILDCTRFIKGYSETKNFWIRLGKNVVSETDAILAQYNSALDGLMQGFRDRALRDTYITNHQLLEDVERLGETIELSSIAYATGAGIDTSKKCLEDTRIEVLREIVNWINDHRDGTPRMFWLSGQAGKGKSAIAHTIATWVDSLGWMTSCFCFARDRQTERRHEKIFATIASDVASRDPLLRRSLARIVRKDPSLKSSTDVSRQWEKLIHDLLKGFVGGNVVIVVDALDESGDESSRKQILKVLKSARVMELPPTVRIFVTSRASRDICDALENVPHIMAKSLDTVDATTANRDIGVFISSELNELKIRLSETEIGQLTEMSDGLFEWARLACQSIKPRKGGVDANELFVDLISRTRGQGQALLDNMYNSILHENIHDSPTARARFQSVMRQILWTAQPLPIPSLNVMRKNFETDNEPVDVRNILDFMGALLSGVTDDVTPVRPLHSSFYDFLIDPLRSGDFYVDKMQTHLDLALASVRVMKRELRFNICGLESSYVRNSEVKDLGARVMKCISPHLSYACQYWAHHTRETKFNGMLVAELKVVFQTEYILFWIEVLSFLKSLDTVYVAMSTLIEWIAVS